MAPPSNLAIRKVFPDWLSSCTCQRGRREKILEEEGNKQANKKEKDIFRASKKKKKKNSNNNNNNNSNSKTLHLQSLYLISIFRNEIAGLLQIVATLRTKCCLQYCRNLLKRLAMTWRALINEANFLKRDWGVGCLSHLVASCMRGCGFVYVTVLTENALECSRKFRRKNKPKILCNVLPKKKGHTMMAFIQSMSSVWSPLNKFSPVEFIKDFGHGPCSQTTYLGSEITKTHLPKMLGKLLKVKF